MSLPFKNLRNFVSWKIEKNKSIFQNHGTMLFSKIKLLKSPVYSITKKYCFYLEDEAGVRIWNTNQPGKDLGHRNSTNNQNPCIRQIQSWSYHLGHQQHLQHQWQMVLSCQLLLISCQQKNNSPLVSLAPEKVIIK